MVSVFNGILYKENPKRFGQIREIADGFSRRYVGQNIIRDDIFNVIENYARTKEIPLEWLRFPIEDSELCACTFIRGGRIFVMLNSGIPLSKQIFAAAHELYHIRCYLEDDGSQLARSGSFLDAKTIDTGTTEEEEMAANAFAGVLLIPADALEQQSGIYRIDKNGIGLDEVLTLMEIFAVPYKAMVLRLAEEQIVCDALAEKMLEKPMDEIRRRMNITGKAKRWDSVPSGCEKFGSLLENLVLNTDNEVLPKSRLDCDWKELERIKKKYGIE